MKKKIIISESQSRALASLLNEETYQMPVDKKMNKPYCINPDKVLIVKKFLDKGFTPHDYEKIGDNGLPVKIKVVSMNASNGEPLKWMYKDQLLDLLIDKFQHMFSDTNERGLFLKQVMDDWFNGAISIFGGLSKNSLRESNEQPVNESISSEEITAEASKVNTNPTDAQKKAGNYRMAHISVKGMKISIENPRGSYRKYKKPNGEEGMNLMKNHYGYFNITKGKDGDAVDVFIGPNIEGFKNVYCVDQNNSKGEFDETKVMLGFDSKDEAKQAYLDNYSPDWKGFRKITGVSLKHFKQWLYRGRKQRQPFAEYASIKKRKIEESKVLKEEEYCEIRRIAKMWDEKAAYEVAEELKAQGIDAYNEGKIVVICVERSAIDDDYVMDVCQHAKNIAKEYAETHKYAVSVNESSDLSPFDVYNHIRTHSPRTGEVVEPRDEPEFEHWKRVRKINGKMNLKNTETDEFISDTWYDWIGYLIKGLAIVGMHDKGYNLINEKGEIVLPEWHEDVVEQDMGDSYLLVDGKDKVKITRDDILIA